MKRSDMISSGDFKKMGAKLDASYDAALDLYVMLTVSFGKTHSVTKKALTLYNKISRLKSDLRHLAKENAGGVFGGKEY